MTTDSSRARARADVTPGVSEGSARGFRRGEASEPRAVTEAPAGAVRAVPRVRGADGNRTAGRTCQLRSYSTAPREAPAAAAPPASQQGYSAPEAGYRSPQNRAIMRGSDERSAAREPPRGGVERSGGSYAAAVLRGWRGASGSRTGATDLRRRAAGSLRRTADAARRRRRRAPRRKRPGSFRRGRGHRAGGEPPPLDSRHLRLRRALYRRNRRSGDSGV